MKKFLGWTGLFALAVGAFFLNLYVLTQIWSPIMLPLGLPEIGLKQAWGLDLLFSYPLISSLAMKADDKSVEGIEKAAKSVITSILASLIVWGLVSIVF